MEDKVLEYNDGQKQKKWKETWRRLKKNKPAMVGLVLIIFFFLVAIFADVIVPYEVALEQTADIRIPPCSEHWFGTDTLGRDLFARMVHGIRPSLIIGMIGTIVPAVIGLIIGGAAGYYGGKFDEITMRFMDMIMCIPSTLLALTIVTALGFSMTNLIVALSLSAIPQMAREDRALVMGVAGQDYVKACKSYGTSDARIIFKYLVPNCAGPIIVSASMTISGTIIAAASLSFLGMGIQPPQPEWGYMISEANNVMRTAPYLMIIPGIATLLVALAFNLLGDGLQDATNPKLKD